MKTEKAWEGKIPKNSEFFLSAHLLGGKESSWLTLQNMSEIWPHFSLLPAVSMPSEEVLLYSLYQSVTAQVFFSQPVTLIVISPLRSASGDFVCLVPHCVLGSGTVPHNVRRCIYFIGSISAKDSSLTAICTLGLGNASSGRLESCPKGLAFFWFKHQDSWDTPCPAVASSVARPNSACVPGLGVWVGVMWETFGSMDRTGLGLALVSS